MDWSHTWTPTKTQGSKQGSTAPSPVFLIELNNLAVSQKKKGDLFLQSKLSMPHLKLLTASHLKYINVEGK